MVIDKGGKLGMDEDEDVCFDICFRPGPACNDLADMALGHGTLCTSCTGQSRSEHVSYSTTLLGALWVQV